MQLLKYKIQVRAVGARQKNDRPGGTGVTRSTQARGKMALTASDVARFERRCLQMETRQTQSRRSPNHDRNPGPLRMHRGKASALTPARA
jgi:predicted ATPase